APAQGDAAPAAREARDASRHLPQGWPLLLHLPRRSARAVRNGGVPPGYGVTRSGLSLVAGTALLVGALAGASNATTTPGVLSVAKLVIKDDKVVLVGDDFMTKMGFPHYPR